MTNLFTGVSAFPLTPLRDDVLDERAFATLISRLRESGVDSITALGSTGSYAYLSRTERARAARIAHDNAGDIPLFVGIGDLRTSHIQALADDAQNAGAAGVLLPAMAYQPLTDDDIFGLFQDVTAGLSVPLIVYDNPGTTHTTFSNELYQRIAALPMVASIKIPGVPENPDEATHHVEAIRTVIPSTTTIGVSGDPLAARGLNAGCEAWYSVIAGTLPAPAVRLTRAAQRGDRDEAERISRELEPLWQLFRAHGSYRVIAAIAERAGLVAMDSLPRPIRGLGAEERQVVARTVERLGELLDT